MTNIVFLDCEASGLGPNSWPSEIGWVSSDLSRGYNSCIRPVEGWTHWDPVAEDIHGLSLDHLQRFGLPPHQVAEDLNRDLASAMVMTDSPGQDFWWLQRLYDAAGLAPSFEMPSPQPAVAQQQLQMTWWQIKGSFDASVQLTAAASTARLSGEDLELATGALCGEFGLTLHRAFDDALRHALMLHVIDIHSRPAAEQPEARVRVIGAATRIKDRVAQEWADRLGLAMGADVLSRHRRVFEALSKR